MLVCHIVITVCACTFVTCTLIKINQSIQAVDENFVTMGDFTFWLSLWLRPKAELKLNLRAQLWSEPGLRIKYWLSPEFITIAPTLLVTGQPFLQRRLRLDAGRRLLRWEIDLLRVHTGGSNRRELDTAGTTSPVVQHTTTTQSSDHACVNACVNSVTSSCTSTSVRRAAPCLFTSGLSQKVKSFSAQRNVSLKGFSYLLHVINVKNCSLSTTYNGDMTHRKQQK